MLILKFLDWSNEIPFKIHEIFFLDSPQLPNTEGLELAAANQTIEGIFANGQFPLNVLRGQELIIDV